MYREYIPYYLKDVYAIEDISAVNGLNRYSIDESNFVSDGNVTTCVIGIIVIITRKIRLEFADSRNTYTIKKIITAHIKIGNIIVSYSLGGYAWLNNANCGDIHSTHINEL